MFMELPGKITKVQDLSAPGFENTTVVWFDSPEGRKGMMWICQGQKICKIFMDVQNIDEIAKYITPDASECEADGPDEYYGSDMEQVPMAVLDE